MPRRSRIKPNSQNNQIPLRPTRRRTGRSQDQGDLPFTIYDLRLCGSAFARGFGGSSLRSEVHKVAEGFEEVAGIVWAGGLLFAHERAAVSRQIGSWPSGGVNGGFDKGACAYSSGLLVRADCVGGRETTRTSAMATQTPLATVRETVIPTMTTAIVSIYQVPSFARPAQCPMA